MDDEALRKIDVLEDAPVLYTRREVALADFVGTAWAYFYNGEVSGDKDCGDCWPPPTSRASERACPP